MLYSHKAGNTVFQGEMDGTEIIILSEMNDSHNTCMKFCLIFRILQEIDMIVWIELCGILKWVRGKENIMKWWSGSKSIICI